MAIIELRHAMVEGANLLMTPGRHTAHDGGLAPAEIEVRVATERAAWHRFAAEFRDAAFVSLKAATHAAAGGKTVGFGPAGEAVDIACENFISSSGSPTGISCCWRLPSQSSWDSGLGTTR